MFHHIVPVRPPYLSLSLYIYIYIHTYIHTYIHAYMHTCIHTYIYIYICIYGLFQGEADFDMHSLLWETAYPRLETLKTGSDSVGSATLQKVITAPKTSLPWLSRNMLHRSLDPGSQLNPSPGGLRAPEAVYTEVSGTPRAFSRSGVFTEIEI